MSPQSALLAGGQINLGTGPDSNLLSWEPESLALPLCHRASHHPPLLRNVSIKQSVKPTPNVLSIQITLSLSLFYTYLRLRASCGSCQRFRKYFLPSEQVWDREPLFPLERKRTVWQRCSRCSCRFRMIHLLSPLKKSSLSQIRVGRFNKGYCGTFRAGVTQLGSIELLAV